jgi:hypothetical protein
MLNVEGRRAAKMSPEGVEPKGKRQQIEKEIKRRNKAIKQS